ncbi:acetate--CoA ligase family protein [Alphaproteobacteria bacterium]|nr:acetate--CoA ligase family protein [Alphaproteobacteria bacterium]
MTTLKEIMSPKSIAIVGASDNKTRIGGRPLSNMIEKGFSGEIYPINPNRDHVQGMKAYSSLLDVKEELDFILVAVPSKLVVPVLEQAVIKKAKTALIFSSGFSEIGGQGEIFQNEIKKISQDSGLRVIGPNCLGLFNSANNFFPTFTTTVNRTTPLPGGIAIASQSGAYGSHIYMVAHERGLGIRYWMTTGNEVDLSVGETIQMMAEDPEVHTIMAYAESVKDGEQFTKALDTARSEKKPVIFMKVGRSEVGAAAANSHTASLAGEDVIYDEVLRAHGAYRVKSTEEMLDVAYATRAKTYPTGKNLGVVTISGGGGVLIADAAADEGLTVGPMPQDTQDELKKLVPFASPMNPVDVTAQFFNDLSIVPKFTDLMLSRGGYDALIGFWTTVPGSPILSNPLLSSLKQAMKGYEDKLFINCMVAPEDIVKTYENEGFLCIEDPTRAVVAMSALMFFGEKFNEKTVINNFNKNDFLVKIPNKKLNEVDCGEILRNAGLPIVKSFLIHTAGELPSIFNEDKNKYVMKIVSSDIQHKTDIGGVILNIKNNDDAQKAYEQILSNVKKNAPNAKIDGVMVSPMIKGGIECILGAKIDPVFGPIVMFGLGGIYAEVMKDIAFAEAPLSNEQAEKMILSLKGKDLFYGARGQSSTDIKSLIKVIVSLSNFIAANSDQVDQVEMNPLLVTENQIIALDALIITK